MEIKFTKMHGIGNDYIYIDCMRQTPENPAALSRAMSRRRHSVGSDGLILICPSDVADVRMRVFNADGSEARMCGNGIRSVGKLVYDKNIIRKTSLSVETLGGIKYLELNVKDGEALSVRVDMGVADFTPAAIPHLSPTPLIDSPIEVLGRVYRTTSLSMGNPHTVTLVDDVASLELEKIGPAFESHPLFPERVNAEFIKIPDRQNIAMRVWERGSGETLACGTGACASVAAAVRLGLCDAGVPVRVSLLGGELKITCGPDYRVVMEGPAETVYEGIYKVKEV